MSKITLYVQLTVTSPPQNVGEVSRDTLYLMHYTHDDPYADNLWIIHMCFFLI
jgi:hypothetical protein